LETRGVDRSMRRSGARFSRAVCLDPVVRAVLVIFIIVAAASPRQALHPVATM
jgi:hypothetical protein